MEVGQPRWTDGHQGGRAYRHCSGQHSPAAATSATWLMAAIASSRSRHSEGPKQRIVGCGGGELSGCELTDEKEHGQHCDETEEGECDRLRAYGAVDCHALLILSSTNTVPPVEGYRCARRWTSRVNAAGEVPGFSLT